MAEAPIALTVGQRCPVCENGLLAYEWQEQTVPSAAAGADIRVTVPVWSCPACEIEFTDSRAEEIRHEAVCRHLQRFTPTEVKAIRDGYGMSQEAFARATGIGVASIKRWESGNQIQGEALDNYLRLLRSPQNLKALEAKRSFAGTPVFRTDIATDRIASLEFQLRPGSLH